MRRLVRHAIAAAGVSALAVGVVASGLSQTSASVSAEAIVSASPVAPVALSPAQVAAAKSFRDRSAQDSRSVDRPDLTTLTKAAANRSEALAGLTSKSDERQSAMVKAVAEKKAAAAKKKAAAEKKAAEERAAQKAAEAEAAKERAKAAKEKADRVAAQGYDVGTTAPKAIAKQIMASKFGWGDDQFSCYNSLIMSESAWKVDAYNPSGAYGIPQSLPGNKMASAGSDWRTNPATQITWGLGYVKDVYGTPCSAWSFKQGHNWY